MLVHAVDYAQFAHLRRCTACGKLMPRAGQAQVCDHCGTVVVVPPHGAWPRDLKRWLLLQLSATYFKPWYGAQEQWERTLGPAVEQSIRGERGLLIPRRADAYLPVALARAATWARDGYRVPFDMTSAEAHR